MLSTVELANRQGITTLGWGDLLPKLNGNHPLFLPNGRYIDYTHDAVVDGPEWWQIDDIENCCNHEFSANWSQMGCKKTSTGLWLAQRQIKHIQATDGTVQEHPAILIITSRTGKGTFFQLAPHILEGYTILSMNSDGLYILRDGQEVKIPGVTEMPKTFAFPAVVITHYDLFSRANAGQFMLTKEHTPIVDKATGLGIPMPWTVADHVIERWWDMVWVDEAHKIKDRNGKRAVNIKKIKARLRHLSTGTGFINRPDEIWSLLNFLNRDRYGAYTQFRDAFCAIEDSGSGYALLGGIKPSMVEGFRRVVRDVGPRRTLREVIPTLKEPINIRRDVKLSKVQRDMYNDLKRDLRAMDRKGVPLHSPNVLAALQRMRQICVATPEVISDEYDEKHDRRIIKIKLTEPSTKLDAVMDILEDSAPEDKFVLFSNFRDPLELLKARLEPRYNPKGELKVPGYKYIHMTSEDDDETRYDKWFNQFKDPSVKIFMSTLQLGGESINLTPANYLIFLDRSWSPKDNMQGIGRIDRPGQTQQPFVINIEAINTTDQRVEEVNILKGSWFKQIFDPEVAE